MNRTNQKRPKPPFLNAGLVLLKVTLILAFIAPQASSQDKCQIDESLRDLMNNKFDTITDTPGGGSKTAYISNLSFMDGVSKTQFLSEEGELIDEAVHNGMREAADTNKNIEVNAPGHTVPNNSGNGSLLIDVWFDPDLSNDEKFAKAVAELMDPHGVDILVTGMIIETGEAIQVSPMGVSKPDNTIQTRHLRYANRDELFTEVAGTLALTPKGREEIQKAVKEILEAS